MSKIQAFVSLNLNNLMSWVIRISVGLSYWHRATSEIDDFTWEEIWNHKCYLIVHLAKTVELCVILLRIVWKIMTQNWYTLDWAYMCIFYFISHQLSNLKVNFLSQDILEVKLNLTFKRKWYLGIVLIPSCRKMY